MATQRCDTHNTTRTRGCADRGTHKGEDPSAGTCGPKHRYRSTRPHRRRTLLRTRVRTALGVLEPPVHPPGANARPDAGTPSAATVAWGLGRAPQSPGIPGGCGTPARRSRAGVGGGGAGPRGSARRPPGSKFKAPGGGRCALSAPLRSGHFPLAGAPRSSGPGHPRGAAATPAPHGRPGAPSSAPLLHGLRTRGSHTGAALRLPSGPGRGRGTGGGEKGASPESPALLANSAAPARGPPLGVPRGAPLASSASSEVGGGSERVGVPVATSKGGVLASSPSSGQPPPPAPQTLQLSPGAHAPPQKVPGRKRKWGRRRTMALQRGGEAGAGASALGPRRGGAGGGGRRRRGRARGGGRERAREGVRRARPPGPQDPPLGPPSPRSRAPPALRLLGARAPAAAPSPARPAPGEAGRAGAAAGRGAPAGFPAETADPPSPRRARARPPSPSLSLPLSLSLSLFLSPLSLSLSSLSLTHTHTHARARAHTQATRGHTRAGPPRLRHGYASQALGA
jgi:hypothetical protein